MARLTTLHIQHYLNNVTKLRAIKTPDGYETKDTGEPAAPDTVHNHWRTFKAALECAVDWNLLSRNPADKAKPPDRKQSAGNPFAPHEVADLLKAADAYGVYPLYFAAITTGMREGELLGLRWTAVNLDDGFIMVQQNLHRGGRKAEFGTVKTKNGVRAIRMSPSLVKILREHHKEQREYRIAHANEWQDYGLVFPSMKGTPMLRSNVLRQFRKIRERARISEDHDFHDLRHTNATLLLMSRVPLKTVSGRLGHSSTAFTQDRYGHILAIMEDEAATAIEEMVPDQRTQDRGWRGGKRQAR